MDALPAIQSPHLSKAADFTNPTLKHDEVGREIESLFVSLLLKEMRQAGSEEGLFPGDSTDTLGGLFDLYMSQHITEAGGIGLADSIQQSLKSL